MHILVRAVVAAAALFSASAAHAEPIDDIARVYAELYLGDALLHGPVTGVDPAVEPQPAAARSEHRDHARIRAEAQALIARLDALPPASDSLLDRRRRALRARLTSLELASRPEGPPLPVLEDVKLRFGFTPQFPDLTSYDAALAHLEATMPGAGTVAERIEAMRASARVTPDKIEPVFRAALAECRKRAEAHLALSAPETVDVEFVDDDLTPASAGYDGNGHSVLRISKTVPTDVDRLLQHACHEGYPGHHVHYLAMDRELFRARGWPEYGVGISSEPLVPGAEAVAEYGVGLAFPVEERIAFERDVLYPLAGLEMTNADQWRAYLTTRPLLLGSSATIAAKLIEGTIDDAQAQQQLVRYRLQTPEAAAQTVKMIRAFGSYLIASDFGWYAVDRALRGKPVGEHWRLLHKLQSEPMMLDDILKL